MTYQYIKNVDRYAGALFVPLVGPFLKALRRARPARSVLPRRILVLKLWGMGNIVLMMPSLEALQRRYPDARIVLVTLARNAPLAERYPFVHEVWPVAEDGPLAFVRSLAATVARARKERFDLLLDFEQFARCSELLCRGMDARCSVGFCVPSRGRGRLYDTPVEYREDGHMVELFYRLALAAGATGEPGPLCPPPLRPEDRRRVEHLLAEVGIGSGSRLVGVHVGSGDNFPGRRWPLDRFARLVSLVTDRLSGVVVFTGTNAEREMIETVRRRAGGRGASLAGRLTLCELAALLDRCRVFVSTDTGPMHLSAAVGTPTLALFGPNTPQLYGPRGAGHAVVEASLPCRPCISNFNAKSSRCSVFTCMQELTADMAYAALADLLGAAGDQGPKTSAGETASPSRA